MSYTPTVSEAFGIEDMMEKDPEFPKSWLWHWSLLGHVLFPEVRKVTLSTMQDGQCAQWGGGRSLAPARKKPWIPWGKKRSGRHVAQMLLWGTDVQKQYQSFSCLLTTSAPSFLQICLSLFPRVMNNSKPQSSWATEQHTGASGGLSLLRALFPSLCSKCQSWSCPQQLHCICSCLFL